MSRWRMIELYKDEGLSGYAGRKILKVDRTHLIGELYLAIRASNGADQNCETGDEHNYIETAITSLVLKAGSKKYKDYPGDVCQLMATLQDGRFPPEILTQVGGAEGEAVFPIKLGRYPQDEQVILPAPLDSSLDLVIDYNFHQSASEGFAATGVECDLYGVMLEPEGVDMESKDILVQEHKQDYTTTGGGTKPFDLTLDERRQLRKIWVQCYEHSIAEGVDITDLKVLADNNEVWAQKWIALQHMNAVDYNIRYERYMKTEASAANVNLYTRIPNVEAQWEDEGQGAVADYHIDTVTGDAILWDIAAQGDLGLLRMKSQVLPTMVAIDFDRDGLMRNLLPQGVRSLKLVLEDAAAGGAVKIFEESIQKWWRG